MNKPKIIKIYGNKVWIETDFAGDAHVMLQSEAPDSKPHELAVVNYVYPYIDNANRNAVAQKIAAMFGATNLVEFRYRPPTPPAQPR